MGRFFSTGLAIALLIAAGTIQAAQRTFVSSSGNDTFPCSLTQPCRSFATAIIATDVGGEIIVLDSAGYGPVTISKSVSINAPSGVYAGVSALSGNGINIVGAGLNVTLRGLNVNAVGGVHGVNIADASFVRLERVIVSGFSSNGIKVLSTSLTRLEVEDTVLQGNVLNGADLGGPVNAVFSRITSTANGNGLAFADGVWAEVFRSTISNNTLNGVKVSCFTTTCLAFVKADDTVIAHNAGNGIAGLQLASGSGLSIALDGVRVSHNGLSGIYITTTPGVLANVFVVRSNSNYNHDGILIEGAGSQGTVSDSAIEFNAGFGMAATNGGAIFTRSNSVIVNNTTNTTGSITPIGGL